MQIYLNAAILRIKSEGRIRIADLRNDLSRCLFVIHMSLRCHFSKNMDLIRCTGYLARNMGRGILLQQGIQDAIGDLITNLVRVPAGHRF